MAAHSSTLAWKIPLTEEPGRLQSMGSQRVRRDGATSLFHIHSFEAQFNDSHGNKIWKFVQVLEKATPTGSSAADEIQSLSFHYIVFCLFMCTVIHTCIHSHILFHYGLP